MSHRVLLSFELPDGTPISAPLARGVAGMSPVALGHFALPEQTPPEVGRDQFGDDAERALTTLIEPLAEQGVDVDRRVVFGRDRAKTIDRIADEEQCDVVFVPGASPPAEIDRLFVPLRDAGETDVLSFAAELAADSAATVTVFHAEEAADRQPTDQLLAEAVEQLTAAGLTDDRIETELAGGGNVRGDVVERAADFDAIVLGASEPSLRDRLLGARPAGITLDTDRPAFVVGTGERRD